MPSPVKNGSSMSSTIEVSSDHGAKVHSRTTQVPPSAPGAKAKVRTGRSPLGLKQQDSRGEEEGGVNGEEARLVAGKENAAAALSSSKSAPSSSSSTASGKIFSCERSYATLWIIIGRLSFVVTIISVKPFQAREAWEHR